MKHVTLSGLQRASVCAASVVLPRYDSISAAANLGNALHEVIDSIVKGEPVLAEVVASQWDLQGVERGRFFSLARGFRPKIPAGALAEVALGLFDDGGARTVKGGQGQYDDAPGLLLPGTIDVMWSEPAPLTADGCPAGSTLWIVDWKTGTENNVPPPAKNWQLRAAAVIAARWTGASRVIPAICFVEEGEGRWDIGAPIEADELDAIYHRIVDILSDIVNAAVAHVNGQGPRATTGPHCEHCLARPGCPAHVAEVRGLLAHGAPIPSPLTRDDATRLAGLLGPAAKVLEMAKIAVRAYAAEHGPIPLADGKVYGPQHASRDVYATRPSYEALAAEIGDEAADAAFRTSKGAIYDAISDAHEAAGVKRRKGAAAKRVLERIAATGGKTSRPVVVWAAHYPEDPSKGEP